MKIQIYKPRALLHIFIPINVLLLAKIQLKILLLKLQKVLQQPQPRNLILLLQRIKIFLQILFNQILKQLFQHNIPTTLRKIREISPQKTLKIQRFLPNFLKKILFFTHLKLQFHLFLVLFLLNISKLNQPNLMQKLSQLFLIKHTLIKKPLKKLHYKPLLNLPHSLLIKTAQNPLILHSFLVILEKTSKNLPQKRLSFKPFSPQILAQFNEIFQLFQTHLPANRQF